ncbi:MAG: hypothetical protein ACRYG7_11760 [Janthinobacterium lividum]
MRLLLLLTLLLGLSSPAITAQSLPPARPPLAADTLASLPLAADTAAAIHRLFMARRKARTRILLLTGGSLLLVGLVSTYTTAGQGTDVTTLDAYLVALGVTALGIELIACSGYSHRNERFVLHDLQVHKLSRSIKRDLAPKYFLPAK